MNIKSLKFFSKAPINAIPALVQIINWRRPGHKPLSEPMMVSLWIPISANPGRNLRLDVLLRQSYLIRMQNVLRPKDAYTSRYIALCLLLTSLWSFTIDKTKSAWNCRDKVKIRSVTKMGESVVCEHLILVWLVGSRKSLQVLSQTPKKCRLVRSNRVFCRQLDRIVT